MKPIDLSIYRLPNGWEVAAVEQEGKMFLYLESEFSEDARPSLFFDPTMGVRFSGFDECRIETEPEQWTYVFRTRELEETDRQIVSCDVCGRPVWEPENCPGVMDEVDWQRMALQHEEGCEWIATRAYRL